jgi:hypothetical protein
MCYPGTCLKGLRKNTKNCQDIQSQGRDLNSGPSEYEGGVNHSTTTFRIKASSHTDMLRQQDITACMHFSFKSILPIDMRSWGSVVKHTITSTYTSKAFCLSDYKTLNATYDKPSTKVVYVSIWTHSSQTHFQCRGLWLPVYESCPETSKAYSVYSYLPGGGGGTNNLEPYSCQFFS